MGPPGARSFEDCTGIGLAWRAERVMRYGLSEMGEVAVLLGVRFEYGAAKAPRTVVMIADLDEARWAVRMQERPSEVGVKVRGAWSSFG